MKGTLLVNCGAEERVPKFSGMNWLVALTPL
jgi:hypothetical protein